MWQFTIQKNLFQVPVTGIKHSCIELYVRNILRKYNLRNRTSMDIKSTQEIHLFSLTLMERKNFMRRLFKPGVVKVEKNKYKKWLGLQERTVCIK